MNAELNLIHAIQSYTLGQLQRPVTGIGSPQDDDTYWALVITVGEAMRRLTDDDRAVIVKYIGYKEPCPEQAYGMLRSALAQLAVHMRGLPTSIVEA